MNFRLFCSLFIAWFLLTGCQDNTRLNRWTTDGKAPNVENLDDVATLTIGDVDPDTPSDRAKNLRPLADYLAIKLGWGPKRVRIRIARSIDEVAMMMQSGQVDLLVDSAFPSLFVRRKSGSEIVLEAPVDGNRQYNGVIVAPASGDIQTLADLKDNVIAFQERYSTSSYLLPIALIQSQGLTPEYIRGAGGTMTAGNVGFLFSGDDENTLALLREGVVGAGALSTPDYMALPDPVRENLVVLARTGDAPRKLVSIRPGLSSNLSQELISALIAVDDEDRKKMIDQDGWYWEFRLPDSQTLTGIAMLEQMIDQAEEVLSN